jgi:hypothetical protein
MRNKEDIKLVTTLIPNLGKEYGDTNNCTIVALSIAAGIPYEEAYEIGKEAGRKKGNGFYTNKLMATARKYGIDFKKMRYKEITINKFLKLNLKGRYLVRRRGHAFTIIDSTIYDVLVNPTFARLIEVYLVKSHRLERLKAM